MPFLGPALGYMTAMCSPGWGNLVAFDWNDLPVGREFDCKFLKNVKSPPHALPPPLLPARATICSSKTGNKLTFWQVRDGLVRFEVVHPNFGKVSHNIHF